MQYVFVIIGKRVHQKTRNLTDDSIQVMPHFYISPNNVMLLDTINSNTDKQKVPDDKENTTPQQNTQNTAPTDSEVILRRTHSFESDAA